jgi:RNA polymerase sigma-70 factor (ECF subfamily)
VSWPTADDSAETVDSRVSRLVRSGHLREGADLLVTVVGSELRPFLHRLLGEAALAEEAYSTTCERLWRGLATFRWECSLRSWAYIVARREAARCRARQARIAARQTTLSAAENVRVPTGSRPALSTTRRDQLELLRESISDEDRDLLVMRVERGLPWKEIAASFLDEGVQDAESIVRESARLRQRFRAIRGKLASILGKDPTDK